MTEDLKSLELFLRSDGHAEDGDNNFAVIMTKRTGTLENIAFFNYKASFTSKTTRIEWNADENLALLSEVVANALINRNYARKLTPDEVDALNQELIQPLEPIVPIVPVTADAVAKAKADAVAKAKADAVAKAKADAVAKAKE